MQISNWKMQIEILKFRNSYYGCEIAKKRPKIYSERKGENSQRNFRFERARKVDSRTLSKIFKET
jgi:hypothetical protein